MTSDDVRIALDGAARIGAAHAETLARRVPGADLIKLILTC